MSVQKRGRVYYSNFMVNGRQIHRALDTDRKIAEAKEQRLKDVYRAQKYGHAVTSLTFQEFIGNYFNMVQGVKSRYTLITERRAVRYLEEFRHISRLKEITPQLLEDLRLSLKAKGKAAPGINRDVRALKAIMRWAEKRGLRDKADWSLCGKFREARGRVDFFTPAEFARLLAKCRHPHERTLALLCCYGGLRQSEAYWLEWRDIDLERATLSVGPKKGWMPKSESSVRTVPLAGPLLAHLKASRPKAASPWVIADGAWRPASANAMGAEFHKNVIRGARLRGRLHILRHTCASWMAQAGVDLYSISKILGHSSITQTEMYSHLCPNTLAAAVARMPGIPTK